MGLGMSVLRKLLGAVAAVVAFAIAWVICGTALGFLVSGELVSQGLAGGLRYGGILISVIAGFFAWELVVGERTPSQTPESKEI